MNAECQYRIYRCSYLDEATWLDPSDQALIVEGNIEQAPDGYGLYLAAEGRTGAGMKTVYNLPDNCTSGAFVMPVEVTGFRCYRHATNPTERYIQRVCATPTVSCVRTQSGSA